VTMECARKRLYEAAIDLRWAREKNGEAPSEETKSGLDKAEAEWHRAHTMLKNAAATFGTSEDKEMANRETLP
jgi:hypothetical protein